MSIKSNTEIIVRFEYLKNIPPDQVYLYLKSNAENKNIDEVDSNYLEIENLLFTLNQPLINLGLAQHGYDKDIIEKIYLKGDKALKLAALMNRKDNFHVVDTGNRSWMDRDFIKKIINLNDENEKYALLTNPLIGASTLTELFEKKLSFEGVTENNWQNLLRYSRDNILLKTTYDNHYVDGYTDFSYSYMLRSAWKLADTVPVTKEWASTLWFFLSNTYARFDITPLETINRWESLQDDSIDIRMVLVRVLPMDALENFKNSNETAIRRAYYQVFCCSNLNLLDNYFQKDKDLFLDGVIWNENMYRNENTRNKLCELTLKADNGDLAHYNWFCSEIEKYKKNHPEWFEGGFENIGQGDDSETSEEIISSTEQFKKLCSIFNLLFFTFVVVVSIAAYLWFK